ncbi:Rossmann-fold NAD(P)-binding domain-containing protein [Microbacterium sp. GXF7504]
MRPEPAAAPTSGADDLPACVWAPTLPPPPGEPAAHRVRVTSAAGAADPLAVAAFADLLAHLRAQQVVRALSARTNRVLAGTRVTVLGDGVLTDAVAAVLERMGARVGVATDTPAAALRHRLRGRAVQPVAEAATAPAEHVVATGEGHAPFDAARLAATTIDASYTGTGVAPASDAAPVRAGVTRTGAGWIVAAPPIWPDDPASAADLERRALDAFLLLSRLAAASADDLDRRFATEVDA